MGYDPIQFRYSFIKYIKSLKGEIFMSSWCGGLFEDEEFLIILVLFILLVIIGAGVDC